MRGLGIDNESTGGGNLNANLPQTEELSFNPIQPTPTGFKVITADGVGNKSGDTFVYIAIRRGPMKVPTVGTSVFAPVTYAGNSSAQTITAGFRVDMELVGCRTGGQGWEQAFVDRLRGNGRVLSSSGTDVEQNWSANLTNEFQSNTGTNRTDAYLNFSSLTFVDWMFQRAPSFFDVVCYTGTGGASQSFTHNLGIAPELVIVKCRGAAAAWESLGTALSASQRQLYLNRTQAGVAVASGHLGWNGTDGAYKAPTSTLVYFGGDSDVGGSGLNYVAYLFATCAGVSKVGSFTNTGSTINIECGFAGSARFIMAKRTSDVGSWWVYDTARGLTSGDDKYLALNLDSAEGNGDDVDPYAGGFTINGALWGTGDYIFLAIA
jgi:hypothetical protein